MMPALPAWVPREAAAYLAHTETGLAIRALAREEGVHASTVLRQVRALEARREDVLVDKALSRLGRHVRARPTAGGGTGATPEALSADRLEAEARRVLRRMCESGAVLAVAAEMDNAVVVRETASGDTTRLAVVERAVAEAMALKEWIACARPSRISRYHITGAGRAALSRLVASAENCAVGFAEAQQAFDGVPCPTRARPGGDDAAARPRHRAVETPLALLARRRDRSGGKFLSDDLVRAGERLREDYELAALVPCRGESWDRFLTAAEDAAGTASPASKAARGRVIGALRDLGPGLGDVALRCCCYLEGLEQAEAALGWSARSGKVVLRIALQRLKRHYATLGEAGGLMG
jgi:transposase-like protein